MGVELGGQTLESFVHLKNAIYLLGAEDYGIPDKFLARCDRIVTLPSVRWPSYNVALQRSLRCCMMGRICLSYLA